MQLDDVEDGNVEENMDEDKDSDDNAHFCCGFSEGKKM